MATDDISSLIDDLTYNKEIEKSIRNNGGTVVYSYNNIIIASEISDAFFTELSKNPYVEFVYDTPLKSYGDIDINLIDQLDETKIPKNQSGGTSNIETGVAPVITSILTVSAYTNELYSYRIVASGTQPIVFFLEGTNLKLKLHQLSLNGDVIFGTSTRSGSIEIKAQNDYGSDIKTLEIQIVERPLITSELVSKSKVSGKYYYEIVLSGPTGPGTPKNYYTSTLPVGLSLYGNVISGYTSVAGVYEIEMTGDSIYGSDTKTLVLTVGSPPIILGNSVFTIDINEFFTYEILTSGAFPSGLTYGLHGTLPDGLTLNSGVISGIATTPRLGSVVTISASNMFGTAKKDIGFNVRGNLERIP